jgi:hypothetical protein
MAGCCGGSSTALQVSGTHLAITGAGSSQNPYIISDNVTLTAGDNTVFDTTVTGLGTTGSPWVVSVGFAGTAKLDDVPDVVITAVANAQVLGWDSATSKWTNRAPTTAASGSVQHDTSMTGDGSGGSPLQINEDSTGFLATAAGGLGLSDTGKRRIVRHFTDAAARAAMTPTPDLNTITMLDNAPGQIDYWNGTVWVPQGQFKIDYGTGQLLALSGGYTGGRLTHMIRQVAQVTDASGLFDVLSTTDLTGYAGVMSAQFQPTGSVSFATNLVVSSGTKVQGQAYKLLDGSVYPLQGVAGVVSAWLYN